MDKQPFRRAALLAVTLGVAACDVAAFATDPKPIFEQTWNLPVTHSSISVAELVPANVQIYSTPGSNPPDSSAFQLTIANVVFSRRLGADCDSCQIYNGQTRTKPPFTLVAGSASNLPTNVLSAAVLGGSVTYSIVNNLSFDPIRVRAATDPTQGYLVILVRSGSIVLGRDSVDGRDRTFLPGTTLTGTIPIGTGTATGAISVDLTVESPRGDHPETINANGTLQTTAGIPDFRAGNIRINVPDKSIATDPESLDLGDFGSNVQSATLEMSVLNPWPVAGTLSVNFATTGQTLVKPLSIPAGSTPASTQVRSVTLDKADVEQLVGEDVQLNLTGTMNATAPITVTPRQQIAIDNRLIITVQTGGGK